MIPCLAGSVGGDSWRCAQAGQGPAGGRRASLTPTQASLPSASLPVQVNTRNYFYNTLGSKTTKRSVCEKTCLDYGLWRNAEMLSSRSQIQRKRLMLNPLGGAFGFIYASTNERWRLGSKQESDSVLGMNPPR